MWGFIGWALGIAVRFIYPYIKVALETVAEANDWSAWPRFEWKYLTLFIIGIIELGIGLLLYDGMIAAVGNWSLFAGFAVGYAGTEMGKIAIDIGIATAKISRG